MSTNIKYIKELIYSLGYRAQEGEKDIFYKYYSRHNNYCIHVNFENERIDYGDKINVGDRTTSNFENSENFIVLECINRLLEKGYAPKSLSLEHKLPVGHREKGKLDILVLDSNYKAYLMIECKTYGIEYDKERRKMLIDGGQLFTYYAIDTSAKFLCLYTSLFDGKNILYKNSIIAIDNSWKLLNTSIERFQHWNKKFKSEGIFEDSIKPYRIQNKAITYGALKPLTMEDSSKIFNQFAEILRHNVVSDKPNAFNKMLNLFICKIIDENKRDDEEVAFQWYEDDTDEKLQLRLNDLYKEGMKQFLEIDITDFSDEQLNMNLINLNEESMKKIQSMFIQLRLQKNPEFAFKEVFDERSFKENAIVVREVVELLQGYQFRYGHKQQFLGNFFELLLNTSIKQEAGQFFTPVPIAKFIILSLPIKEMIIRNITQSSSELLPTTIDYAAGSGHFITEWLDIVQGIINKLDTSKFRPEDKRKINAWKTNPFSWAKKFVYGIEADYRLTKTTKVSSFLNGDGDANIIHADGLDNFKTSTTFKGKLKYISKIDSKDNSQFDVLIANPPYSVSAFKNTIKDGKDSFELFNRLTDNSSEIECLFVERAKQLLKPGGYAGIILPSSILNNTGIYSETRKIILKYFKIKAIVEFGSNTFMATGTNTITLFLKRRHNIDNVKISTRIKSFFDRPKDATVLSIEKAFSKYVNTVFINITLDDYITFINKEPNDTIKKQDFYNDYIKWFNNLTEIKKIKKTKIFKELSDENRQKELDRIFYDKVFEKEKERILYFLLTYEQNIVIVQTGEKQLEKDFLGYEFSNRRGYEGIRLYRDKNGKATTKLYDEDDVLNIEKVNYYIYKAFLDERIDIHESLKENVKIIPLKDCLNFGEIENFETINLVVKKNIKSKYLLGKLGDICNIKIGGTPSRNRDDYYKNGNHLWVSISEMDGNIIKDTKEKITDLGVEKSNVKLVQAGTTLLSFKLSIGKTAIAGKDLYTNEAIAALEIKNKYKNRLFDKYIFCLFESKFINLDEGGNKAFGKSLNTKFLKELKIPLPSTLIQKKIIDEIDLINNNEKKIKEEINMLQEKIDNIIEQCFNSNYELKQLDEVADIYNGGTPKTTIKKYWNGDIYWATLVDTKEKYLYSTTRTITEDGIKNSNANILPINTVLFSSRATIGNITIAKIPISTNQGFKNFVCDNKVLFHEYLYYILKHETKNIKDISKGMTYLEISKSKISKYKIPVPSIKTQKQIISKILLLESQISKIKVQLSTQYLEKEKILKKYLK